MGKVSDLKIKESEEELNKLRKSQRSLKFEKRVIALQKIKGGESGTRQELSDYLGIGKRTLEGWLTSYSREGIEQFLTVKPRRKGSKIITSEIHEGLKQRVNDPHQSFLGYWDAQQWVEQQYGVHVKYHWLRKYLINRFGTKVKSPRKSHVKKDQKAQDSFLKTTQENETYYK